MDDAGLVAERWMSSGRRQRRTRLIFLATTLVALAGGWMAWTSHVRRVEADQLWRLELRLVTSDAAALAEVLDEAARSEDPSPARMALAARAEMVRYVLHTQRATEARHAMELVEALPKEAVGGGEQLARAMRDALFGPGAVPGPEEGLGWAEGHPWNAGWAFVDQMRARREGRVPDSLAVAPAVRSVRALDAVRAGEWQVAKREAEALLADAPGHEVGRVVLDVLSARQLPVAEGIAQLTGWLQAGNRTAVGTSLLAIEVIRRTGEVETPARQREVAEAAWTSQPSAPWTAAEVSRVQRLQGLWSAARQSADAAWRDHPWEPVAALSWLEAAIVLDDPAILERRLADAGSAVPPAVVSRGQAWVAWLRGEASTFSALPQLESTAEGVLLSARFGGEAGYPAALAAAVEHQVKLYGERSMEGTLARYVQLFARSSDPKGAGRLYPEVTRGAPRSPCLSWTLGAATARLGRPKDARDHLLDACFRGQDFALGCLELAGVYEVLGADGPGKDTQRQARERYLRLSPKGVHAEAVRAALGGAHP